MTERARLVAFLYVSNDGLRAIICERELVTRGFLYSQWVRENIGYCVYVTCASSSESSRLFERHA